MSYAHHVRIPRGETTIEHNPEPSVGCAAGAGADGAPAVNPDDALLATADALVAAFLAVDSSGHLAGPQTRVAEAQKAMAAATATSLARREELSEERQNNFASWQSWPDGRTLSRWLPRADLLVQAIDARDNALASAWQAEANAVITADDREKFDSGLHVAPTWRHLRSAAVRKTGIAMMVMSPVVWVLTALILAMTDGAVSIHSAIPASVVGLGLVLLATGAVMSNPTWRRHNSAARAAASARRIELLGFDPLAEPDRLPLTWTDSPSPRNRLDRFLREVYTNFPSADELPELVLPTVRDPVGEPSPRVRAVLEHFAAVDAARDAEGAGDGALAGEAAPGTTLRA
ncbi:hypothetical protein [Cryobacterium fucosi]|uniref:Uncharacterized protein n=1 Tax=Cryobacterium fucosi TaxID=1259157 RepID=A0A4V3IV26_9MICO|nr:hypothetical protein [Cryobacterium fucosi]TFD76027.1 hypothetical protein E3T48_10640 [Cryobacterium fucosi]